MVHTVDRRLAVTLVVFSVAARHLRSAADELPGLHATRLRAAHVAPRRVPNHVERAPGHHLRTTPAHVGNQEFPIDSARNFPRRCVSQRAKNATVPRVTLLTTLPFVVPAGTGGESFAGKHPVPQHHRATNVSQHLFETLLAIGENARNPLIPEIRVLVDRYDASSQSSAAAETEDPSTALRRAVREQQRLFLRQLAERRRNTTDTLHGVGPTSNEDLGKINVEVFGRQPTYADMFRYANAAFADRLVGLTNADVVARNLHRLDADAFAPPRDERNDTRRLVFVLGVSPPNGTYGEICQPMARCTMLPGSWDTYIFQSPLPTDAQWPWLEEVAPTPVYMNQQGAENRAGIFLHESRYELRKPCLDIIAEHWHCTPQTHHSGDVWNHRSPLLHHPGARLSVTRNGRGLLDEC